MTWRFIQIVLGCLLCLLSGASAYSLESDAVYLRGGESCMAILGGYGATHVGMGETREFVETADLVLRYGRILRSDMGSSWLRGHHDLLIEVPVHLVMRPITSPIFGMNFLASYFLSSYRKGEPYILAGGGPVYTEADIPGVGSRLNGNYQAGIGFLYNLKRGYNLNMEYRFHHISNSGTEYPNVPLNSSKILLGITFF
ncbi:MAG TPA: acyloxyacyl hydrolase [Nitrospiraceae bacterium]|nr:acyloxyacyl hydrolase [Nitrospiraceae bacterium]HBI24063.1 acyloxyacyl hydrolase [Nitrospiraceae bacterium]